MTKKNKHTIRDETRGLDEADGLVDEAAELERRADELERKARELEEKVNGGASADACASGNEHVTDITIVLDRSGSMNAMRRDAIDSFNGFVKEQRGVPGQASVTLVQFDHEYEPVFEGCPLEEVPDLTHAAYRPRGRTALFDAIGRTILCTERRLEDQPSSPKLVVFVILTDGLENASREYRRHTIFDMISERESEGGWRFAFLGADQDAITEGGRMGICDRRSLSVGPSPSEYRAANVIVGQKIARYRQSADDVHLDFTEKERKEAKRS